MDHYFMLRDILSSGPYLGFFVCGGKLGFREISDQYSYKKQPSKIRHYVRKKTFSFPGGGNCPLRPPAMYGPVVKISSLRYLETPLVYRETKVKKKKQKKIDLNLMKYQSDFLIDLKGDVTQTIRNDDF